MRAVIYDPEARANLRLADVDEPVAAEADALIEVRATALNVGEVHFIDRMRKPGEVPGWDAAGVVVRAAADGSGPPVGSRVVGFHGAGGWAQRRAVPTENLAVLPDSVDFGLAAALPVAGVTALQALRRLGPVVGRRVLITGASGGVGRFAVHKRLEPFTVGTPFGPDLAYLVELLAVGEFDPQVGLRTSWNEVSEAAEALLDRRVPGKAVLDVA